MKYYLIFLCSLMFFTACDTSKFYCEDEKLKIEVEIKKIKEIERNTYKLRCHVRVQNLTDEVCLFDLKKIQLQIENKAEYGVYIDSIASRLIEVQKIKPRMMYSENVYWIVHSNNKIVLHGINYSEV